MNKLLRIISVLMLLIISRFSHSETISASSSGSLYSFVFMGSLSYTLSPYSDVESACAVAYVKAAAAQSSRGYYTSSWDGTYCNIYATGGSYGTFTTKTTLYSKTLISTSYSCSDGYYLSDSSGVADSAGHYCTSEPQKTCAELAAAGGSVLGSGYFISGSSSSLCVQANSSYKCAATNTGSSLYFTTVSDTCSYGTAAGTYFYYTGAECDTEGALSNNYADGTAAAAACPSPTTDTTSSATTTDTTSSATSTASSATPTGCATITDGDTTLTSCETVSDTGTTSSATSTTASTDTASTTTTTSSATGTGNTYNTTNNTTTTNNNSTTSTVTNNYAASAAESTDESITTASTVTADYKDAVSANDWSSRNYTTVLSDHVSELKSSEIYSTASTFFAVNFSGGGCEPWGGTFELMGYSFTLSLDVCSFIAPYGVWMAAVVIFVCSFFAYRIAME